MVLGGGDVFGERRNADEFFTSEADKRLVPRIVVKTADELRTSNEDVLTNDAELFTGVDPDSTYDFEFLIGTDTSSTTPDIKWIFDVPTGATGTHYTTILNSGVGDYIAEALGGELSASLPGNIAWIQIKGILITGQASGNLHFKWAQSFTSGDTTVKQNSFLKVTKR